MESTPNCILIPIFQVLGPENTKLDQKLGVELLGGSIHSTEHTRIIRQILADCPPPFFQFSIQILIFRPWDPVESIPRAGNPPGSYFQPKRLESDLFWVSFSIFDRIFGLWTFGTLSIVLSLRAAKQPPKDSTVPRDPPHPTPHYTTPHRVPNVHRPKILSKIEKTDPK